MMRMGRLNPKLKEIQTKYANNKEKQNEEVARLYQEEGVNPMSGCLWSLLPFPILIALYSIIRKPLSSFMMLGSETVAAITAAVTATGYEFTSASVYQEIEVAKYVHQHFADFSQYAGEGLFSLDYQFLGLDLSAIPSNFFSQITTGGWPVIGLMLIPILAGGTSLLMSLVGQAGTPDAGNAGTNRSLMLMMPLLSVYIAFTMPAALGIYWIANSVFSILQDLVLNKHYTKILEKEEQEREVKRAAARKFRQEEARRQALEQKEEPKKEAKKKKEEKEPKGEKNSTTENGRVGDRPYARGRAFKEEHYE